MNPLLIAALISGALSAGLSGWGMYEWQEGRYAQKELEHVQQHADEAREATRMERQRAKNASDARDDGTRRMAALRADATRARDAVDGVRDATAAVLRNASASLEACTVSAAALGKVFRACVAEYQAVGELADGHASDAMMLDQAWPE